MDHLTNTGSRSAEKVTPASASDALVANHLRNLDELGALIDLRLNEIAVLRNRLHRYRAAMEFIRDELEEDFDTIDGDDGQPRPNKAMRLANEIDEAIYGPGGF